MVLQHVYYQLAWAPWGNEIRHAKNLEEEPRERWQMHKWQCKGGAERSWIHKILSLSHCNRYKCIQNNISYLIICFHQARFPFLDEDVIRTLLDIPLWEIADLDQPSGVGDKKILREVRLYLWLHFISYEIFYFEGFWQYSLVYCITNNGVLGLLAVFADS